MRTIHTTLFALIALGACTDKPYAGDPDAPAIDPNAPHIHILTPTRGTIAGDVKTITVTGNAADDVGVVSVTRQRYPGDTPRRQYVDGDRAGRCRARICSTRSRRTRRTTRARSRARWSPARRRRCHRRSRMR